MRTRKNTDTRNSQCDEHGHPSTEKIGIGETPSAHRDGFCLLPRAISAEKVEQLKSICSRTFANDSDSVRPIESWARLRRSHRGKRSLASDSRVARFEQIGRRGDRR